MALIILPMAVCYSRVPVIDRPMTSSWISNSESLFRKENTPNHVPHFMQNKILGFQLPPVWLRWPRWLQGEVTPRNSKGVTTALVWHDTWWQTWTFHLFVQYLDQYCNILNTVFNTSTELCHLDPLLSVLASPYSTAAVAKIIHTQLSTTRYGAFTEACWKENLLFEQQNTVLPVRTRFRPMSTSRSHISITITCPHMICLHNVFQPFNYTLLKEWHYCTTGPIQKSFSKKTTWFF